MDKIERRQLRREVKKDSSKVGFSLLLYAFIMFAVSVVWLIVQLEMATANVTDPAAMERIENEVIERFDQSGASLIAGVLAGLVVLFLLFIKRGTHKEIFRRSESITFGRFIAAMCVFFGGQIVFNGFYMLMEMGLNLIGYTAEASMESATSGGTNFSMLLYAGIIGPIVEEIVYRGFAMRLLEKHGKVLAIVVSSMLFGVMHANLPQSIFAFMSGLVLGYVAMRYSLVWSIILHILNNLALGEGMSWALSPLSENAQTIISYVVMSVFFIAGIAVLIIKRKEIGGYIKENRTQKPKMRWALTAAGMVLFFAVHIAMAVLMIEKL